MRQAYHPSVPPPRHYAMLAYGVGKRDRNKNIANDKRGDMDTSGVHGYMVCFPWLGGFERWDSLWTRLCVSGGRHGGHHPEAGGAPHVGIMWLGLNALVFRVRRSEE